MPLRKRKPLGEATPSSQAKRQNRSIPRRTPLKVPRRSSRLSATPLTPVQTSPKSQEVVAHARNVTISSDYKRNDDLVPPQFQLANANDTMKRGEIPGVKQRPKSNEFTSRHESLSKEVRHSSLLSKLGRLLFRIYFKIFWFCFDYFTPLCIGILILLALWPDHYVEIDMTPARLLLGMAIIYIGKTTWASMPRWVKIYAQPPKDGERGIIVQDANDALSEPTTIMAKLQDMFDLLPGYLVHRNDRTSRGFLDEEEEEPPKLMPKFKIYVCVLAFLDLIRELYHQKPSWRDDSLTRDAGVQNLTREKLRELEHYMNLSALAYEESPTELIVQLQPMGYRLLRHDVATEPGRVGHFIGVDHENKEIVIAIKGTSSIGDVLTDLVAKSVPHELKKPVGMKKRAKKWETVNATSTVYCHEGIYTAAIMMVQDTQHLIQEFFVPAGYSISICGHSLGAGVSCLLGLFLKRDVGIENVKVHAFATPACLSFEASLECQDYVTSVVNNTDCVPRVSLRNVKALYHLFGRIDSRLTEKGLSPGDWKSTKAFLKEVGTVDDDPLLSLEELSEFELVNAQQGEDQHSLFVPGRVLHLWERNDDKKTVDCREFHGGLLTLRKIELSTSMISDHGTDNYKKNLKALWGKLR